MSLNAFVLVNGLCVTNDFSNRDPLLQSSLGIAKRWTKVRQSLLLCSDIGQEPSWNSTQIAESHGRLSEQRVEVSQVTGSASSVPSTVYK
jgi:hypothetical protein